MTTPVACQVRWLILVQPQAADGISATSTLASRSNSVLATADLPAQIDSVTAILAHRPAAPGAEVYAGGIITVSIMYTVAFAVGTPPHTTPALFTRRPLPWPVTVTFAPWRVFCVPSTRAGLS